MAAPSITVRTIPTGYRPPDGFKTLVTLKRYPAIQLWEVSVKPMGFDGGEPIQYSTMHNIRFRTKRPQALLDTMPITFKFMYDPDVLSVVDSALNKDDEVTVKFADGSAECFFGYLQKVEFDEHEIGKPYSGTATVVPTHWDYVNNVEAGPVYAVAPGT